MLSYGLDELRGWGWSVRRGLTHEIDPLEERNSAHCEHLQGATDKLLARQGQSLPVRNIRIAGSNPES